MCFDYITYIVILNYLLLSLYLNEINVSVDLITVKLFLQACHMRQIYQSPTLALEKVHM